MESNPPNFIHVNPAFTGDDTIPPKLTKAENKKFEANNVIRNENTSYVPDEIVKSTTLYEDEKNTKNDEFDEYREIEFSRHINNNNAESAVTHHAANEPAAEYTLKYGWLCISPSLFKYLNSPFFFLICLCFSGIAQGKLFDWLKTMRRFSFAFSISYLFVKGGVGGEGGRWWVRER